MSRIRSHGVFHAEETENADAMKTVETILKRRRSKHKRRKASNLRKSTMTAKEIRVLSCPRCGSDDIVLSGKSRNSRKILCNSCGKESVITRDYNFGSSKLSIAEIEALVEAFYFGWSTESIAFHFQLNPKTVTLWRRRVFQVAENRMDSVNLKGKVWIDEIYFYRSNTREVKYVDKEHIRPGLSSDLIPVCVGVDQFGDKICRVCDKYGMVSSDEVLRTFSGRIEENSHITHDGSKEHKALIDSLDCTDRVVPSKPKTDESLRAMRPINNYCADLRNESLKHVGILNSTLQGWLAFFTYRAYLRKNYDTQEAISILLSKLVSSRKQVVLQKRKPKKKEKSKTVNS